VLLTVQIDSFYLNISSYVKDHYYSLLINRHQKFKKVTRGRLLNYI